MANTRQLLGNILMGDDSDNEDTKSIEGDEQDIDMSDSDQLDPDLCIECGDQPAEVICTQCDEQFCSVCFNYLHRTGKRKQHTTRPFKSISGKEDKLEQQIDKEQKAIGVGKSGNEHEEEDSDNETPESESQTTAESRGFGSFIKERAKDIPMRLTVSERKFLRLLEAALNVSEYTDKVDILSYSAKSKRIVAQLKEMCSILAGLVVATDMKVGQQLFEDKDFSANAKWFKRIFEIGRRYKIMNPERMRDSFGKLMYMVMDSRLPEISNVMEFDFYMPILTVYSFLEEKGSLALLDDVLVHQATVEIQPEGKKRGQVQSEIKSKERAIEAIARRYSTADLSRDDIRQCLYSIGDNHAYLRANRDPVEHMVSYLQKYFDPVSKERDYGLAITYGKGGARLSHGHEKQYNYVHQSLSLWSCIMNDMFKLWHLADNDLLSDKSRYRLSDTGQGLNRIQPSPQLSRAMHGIIDQSRQRTKGWIGSSVVHLGDHNVPNAWFFLDKYLQVPLILNPLNLVLEEIDKVVRDPFVYNWIQEQFRTVEDLKKTILTDFFKHAFDGSGADNFYDAGSCIDGRLTSAWNWANSISKKPYYKVFLLCGFSGFNGTEGF